MEFDNQKLPKIPLKDDSESMDTEEEVIDPRIISPDTHYLVADGMNRLRINQVNELPVNDDQRYRIKTIGKVNYQMDTLYNGFLIKKQDIVGEIENGFHLEHIQRNTYIFGSKTGQVGMIQPIPKTIFDKLSDLER